MNFLNRVEVAAACAHWRLLFKASGLHYWLLICVLVHSRDGFYTCLDVTAVCEVCMLYQKAHEEMTELLELKLSDFAPQESLSLSCVSSVLCHPHLDTVTPPPSALPSSLPALHLFHLSISPVVSLSVHLLSVLSKCSLKAPGAFAAWTLFSFYSLVQGFTNVFVSRTP